MMRVLKMDTENREVSCKRWDNQMVDGWDIRYFYTDLPNALRTITLVRNQLCLKIVILDRHISAMIGNVFVGEEASTDAEREVAPISFLGLAVGVWMTV